MSEMSRAVLRLLADDLTGALDSAAPFVKLCGPIGAHWRLPADPLSPSAAISLGTRDEATPLARARFEAAGGIFKGADLAFHKIDSLLRGHPALEIDIACRQGFSLVIVAPAFPAQGRLTRGGLQRFASGDPVPRERVNPLGRQLQELGHELTFVAHPQGLTKASRGIVFCDAESDEALEDIAHIGKSHEGPVLWSGSSGLARALGGRGKIPSHARALPVLLVLGTDHPVTAQQLTRFSGDERHWVVCHREGRPAAETVRDLISALKNHDAVALTFSFAHADRRVARAHLASSLQSLLGTITKPGSLIVSGGETLQSVCKALGAAWLEVVGEESPGFPIAVLQDGEWDGLALVSKSGAFGASETLTKLVRLATPAGGTAHA